MDVGEPSFTFTLSGTDVYGKKHSYEKQIKFTKAEVEKQMKDHPEIQSNFPLHLMISNMVHIHVMKAVC